ncbi:outer membrane beta-barrel protein [Thalassotalea piscium]|uniref:Outer membrane protein beta-barrel domain-containing protein n=1 Tax=Thalassotalea piscium TaxID=1230533 RepID=A0A7X0TS25_9GAMM|nr:outer membrane beta-barrel protein [Thalassotalea piscium]MBB6541664.1 hypothetical protein [Thalassotalea piscium]
MKQIIILVLLTIFSTNAAANNSQNFFVGASYLSAETDWLNDSEYNSGYDVHLGYNFTSMYKLELSYLDLGSNNINTLDYKFPMDSGALSVSAIVNYPVGDINIIGKLGTSIKVVKFLAN